MAITIDRESRARSRAAVDINYSGNRYRTSNGLFTFPAPNLETIDQYLFFLLKNSIEKKFEIKYKYRPDYLSFDEYGTVGLAHLIMYVNAIPSLEDFDLHMVIIPSFNSIIEMLKAKFPKQKTEDLVQVNW
jgi:alpha-L-fucosidase